MVEIIVIQQVIHQNNGFIHKISHFYVDKGNNLSFL